jgi:hypothetical protein
MNKVGGRIRQSMIRRQEALERFQKKKREYLSSREQILAEIEEARIIWKKTLEQLPPQPFSQ